MVKSQAVDIAPKLFLWLMNVGYAFAHLLSLWSNGRWGAPLWRILLWTKLIQKRELRSTDVGYSKKEAQMSISVKDQWQGNSYFESNWKVMCWEGADGFSLPVSGACTIVMYCRLNEFHNSNISLSIFFSLPSCPAIFHSLPTPSRLDSCRALWFLRITLCDSVSMALTACQCKDWPVLIGTLAAVVD